MNRKKLVIGEHYAWQTSGYEWATVYEVKCLRQEHELHPTGGYNRRPSVFEVVAVHGGCLNDVGQELKLYSCRLIISTWKEYQAKLNKIVEDDLARSKKRDELLAMVTELLGSDPRMRASTYRLGDDLKVKITMTEDLLREMVNRER